MATVVTKTVGTGGDYADWAAFIAACPTNLVSLDQQWDVLFKNQVHSSSTGFDFSTARTTSATCFFRFKAEPGAAWHENASARTRAFAHDTSYGAALVSSSSGIAFAINVSYTLVSGLLISTSSVSATAQSALRVQSSATNCDVDKCIISGACRNTSLKGVVNISGPTNYLRNSLVVQTATDLAAVIMSCGTSVRVINVTAVALNAKLNIGLDTSTGTAPVIKNVGVFNATTVESGTNAALKTTCFADSVQTGWSVAPYSTATFESVTAGSPDFRVKAGSALIDAGTVDATYAVTDATGTARAGATDVGAWEYTNSGTTIACSVGNATVAGSTAAILQNLTISCTVGNAVADGRTLSLGALVTISCGVGNAAAAGSTAVVTNNASGGFTSDIVTNNTGTPMAFEPVVWTWVSAGRVGSMSGKTVTDGTGTLNSTSRLVLSGLPAGVGALMIGILGATPADDAVYYEAGTVA